MSIKLTEYDENILKLKIEMNPNKQKPLLDWVASFPEKALFWRGNNGETLLHWASITSINLTKDILNYIGLSNEKDKFGGTALDWLIERYFITVVTPKAEISEDKKKEIAFLTSQNARILLDHGISTKFDIVDILTKTGAMDFIQQTPLEQLNHISELDKSAIHNWILWSGNEYEKNLNLKKLLKLCDINKSDINGNTPLYYAIDGWLFKPELEDIFKTAIICLLRHHADDQIKNNDGMTIYDLMDEHHQLKFKQWKILSQSEAKSDPVILNGESYSTTPQKS